VTHRIVLDLKSRIKENLDHFDTEMVEVCYAIIDYVSVGPTKKSHLSFIDLYRISPKVEDEIFYDAVFYLTRKNINVLTQEFEALDPKYGFKQVPDKEQILEDMRNEEFFNPFTGESLTEQEFGEQVLSYFTPSCEFVRKLND